MSMVKALPAARSGRAILILHNGLGHSVAVTHALAATKEARGSVPNLLSAPIPLKPDESRTVDVSDELSKLFNPLDKARQEKRIRIRLALNPELPHPQGTGQYLVAFQGGQFTEFSAP